jgi:hypothetical protein
VYVEDNEEELSILAKKTRQVSDVIDTAISMLAHKYFGIRKQN